MRQSRLELPMATSHAHTSQLQNDAVSRRQGHLESFHSCRKQRRREGGRLYWRRQGQAQLECLVWMQNYIITLDNQKLNAPQLCKKEGQSAMDGQTGWQLRQKWPLCICILARWGAFWRSDGNQNIQQQSVPHDGAENFSTFLEVFFLGDDRDALGGEYGVDADLLQVVLGAPAEDLAQFPQREVVKLLDLVEHLAEVLAEVLLREELHEHRHVHVLPPALGVDEADGRVEGGQDALQLQGALAQQQGALLHYPLRFLTAAEEGVELVDDVRFTIFLGAQDFLLYGFFHSSFLLRPHAARPPRHAHTLLLRHLGGQLPHSVAVPVEIPRSLALGVVRGEVQLITSRVITSKVLVVALELFDRGHGCEAVVEKENE